MHLGLNPFPVCGIFGSLFIVKPGSLREPGQAHQSSVQCRFRTCCDTIELMGNTKIMLQSSSANVGANYAGPVPGSSGAHLDMPCKLAQPVGLRRCCTQGLYMCTLHAAFESLKTGSAFQIWPHQAVNRPAVRQETGDMQQ